MAGFDYECPVMSLPLAFGTTQETIPAESPYLTADPADVSTWRARLAALPGRKVGIAWAGNPNYAADAQRSVPPHMLSALADVAGVSFVSLQVPRHVPGGDLPPLAMQEWTSELRDFADTAALISALDLVISVDTAVVHLAGALGVPVWLLNRADSDWRWQRQSETSAWYPSMRIFRQAHASEWASVLAEVRAAL
jgi:hypothetical protein